MALIVSAPERDKSGRPARNRLLLDSSAPRRPADAVGVLLRRSLLRHPGALIITTLAASDLAYRLLLREAVRRALGVRH
jgi:hypothetical protein